MELATVCALTSISLSFLTLGWLSYRRGWYRQAFLRVLRTPQVTNLVLSMVSTVASSQTSSAFTVNDTKTSATITYTRLGKQYLVIVPYNSRGIVSCSGIQVFLVKNGQKIDITQQPGVEYTVTAQQMGGAEVVTQRHGQVVRTFGPDEKIVL